MARNKGPHPSVLRGAPEHGSSFEDDLPLDATNEEVEGDEDEEEEQTHGDGNHAERSAADPMAAMQTQIDMLIDQNRMLQRMIPPPTPVLNSDSEAEDDTDWDTLMFANPKEAVKKIKEQAVNEAKRDLRREYSNDQSTNKFWTDFYNANADLKEDHDLVETLLEKHMAEIGDLPVAKAMEKLADLTRKRIMRYSGGKGQSRSRAVAEGASPPTSKKPAADKPKVTTLTDIIRNRRESRRKAASAA